ncbi:MAG TPA: DUF5335 family protein [Micropepsaceae bacterium]|jgi:hypothetical protein|nr:DUF5335 family protein [Micropepsaceae bacterium]
MAQAIDKSQWAQYLGRISQALENSTAEIEVASLELGSQPETDWLPLIGISYDDKDDVIDIALEGVDHIVNHPKQLRADGELGTLRTLEIRDSEGAQHLVRLKDALLLPAS